MTQSILPLDPTELTVETAAAKELGARYAEAYQSGEPYHHICIDNFLPAEVIAGVAKDLASLPDAERSFDAAQERFKSQYNPDRLPSYSRHLFQTFNSRAFLLFLEQMTGIKGLIPDPYFIGAGIHRTLTGGHLDIHADGTPRQSIALYYYTATWDSSRKQHSTLFKPPLGSNDQSEARARRHGALREALPPVLYRPIIRRLQKFGF